MTATAAAAAAATAAATATAIATATTTSNHITIPNRQQLHIPQQNFHRFLSTFDNKSIHKFCTGSIKNLRPTKQQHAMFICNDGSKTTLSGCAFSYVLCLVRDDCYRKSHYFGTQYRHNKERVAKQKLQYFGHITRGSAGQLVLTVLEGIMEGLRHQGRPRRQWIDDTGCEYIQLKMSQDRAQWRRKISEWSSAVANPHRGRSTSE